MTSTHPESSARWASGPSGTRTSTEVAEELMSGKGRGTFYPGRRWWGQGIAFAVAVSKILL